VLHPLLASLLVANLAHRYVEGIDWEYGAMIPVDGGAIRSI